MIKQQLKVDLDIISKSKAITQLKERLLLMQTQGMIHYSMIENIILIYKTSFSVKINLNKNIKDEKDLIIMQGILGDDWKRLAVSFSDYCTGNPYWNKLFDMKRYSDGSYIMAQQFDVTQEIISCLNNDTTE